MYMCTYTFIFIYLHISSTTITVNGVFSILLYIMDGLCVTNNLLFISEPYFILCAHSEKWYIITI